MDIIKAQPNQFGGMIVEAADLPERPEVFAEQLAAGIAAWKDQGVKVVWLTVPRELSLHIPAAVAAGFVFHHAREDYLHLTLALAPNAHVPPFATHYVGAGGVVLRDDGRLLVVSERYKLLPGRRLKLPGGALQGSEHISDAVVREVKEETGINARFEAVVCLRHWHGYRHGKSDIYFVCRLTPLSFDIAHDPDEIAECLWMPKDEFLADPDVHAFNKRIVRAALESKGLSREFLEGYGTPETHELLFP
jgi:8-oxo-dGTP pyrophosphatase MutT (NUDIX family)